MRAGLKDLVAIYGVKIPYIVNNGVVYFYSRFIELLLLSFDTDSVENMSERERELYNNYVNYEDGLYSDAYCIALGEWLINEVNKIPNNTI